MTKELIHLRDGAVVLYKRERSNKWQARIKIGKGKNSWKRIATGSSDNQTGSGLKCHNVYFLRYELREQWFGSKHYRKQNNAAFS